MARRAPIGQAARPVPAGTVEAILAEGLLPQVAEAVRYIFGRCEVVGECWEWSGARNERGYGRLKVPSTRGVVYAHRVVAEAVIGSTDGRFVCHRCDNPACVRPDHLFIGTSADNVADMLAKGRGSAPRPVDWVPRVQAGRHHLQKLTSDDVRSIRSSLSKGESRRSIATRFGVGPEAISKIAKGERWGHLQ